MLDSLADASSLVESDILVLVVAATGEAATTEVLAAAFAAGR